MRYHQILSRRVGWIGRRSPEASRDQLHMCLLVSGGGSVQVLHARAGRREEHTKLPLQGIPLTSSCARQAEQMESLSTPVDIRCVWERKRTDSWWIYIRSFNSNQSPVAIRTSHLLLISRSITPRDVWYTFFKTWISKSATAVLPYLSRVYYRFSVRVPAKLAVVATNYQAVELFRTIRLILIISGSFIKLLFI